MALSPSFRNLGELESIHLRQAVEIYAAAFYDALQFLSTDLDTIADLLEQLFVPQNHYVALLGGNVVSVVAYSTFNSRSIAIKRNKVVKHLGPVKGLYSYFRLYRALGKKLNLHIEQLYIDSVVTDSAYRGMGIALELQKHVIDNLPFKEIHLEVAQMNFKAIRIYEKMGFKIDQHLKERSFWKPNSEGGKLVMSFTKVENIQLSDKP